jgi:lysophospholipase L1-like esterase
MKTVLCYGDSNTWGYNPQSQDRYPLEARWVSVLARALGPEYLVIPEGLNGRTTVWPDPVEGEHKSGKTYLIPCLESHYPLDLVVLMLGTNDLKHRFGLSAGDIAYAAATLVGMIQSSAFGPAGAAPKVLLIAPPPTYVDGTMFADMFAGADEKSADLGKRYSLVAQENGCAFLDAGQVIQSGRLDGIHFAADALPRLGAAVAAAVKQVLPGARG